MKSIILLLIAIVCFGCTEKVDEKARLANEIDTMRTKCEADLRHIESPTEQDMMTEKIDGMANAVNMHYEKSLSNHIKIKQYHEQRPRDKEIFALYQKSQKALKNIQRSVINTESLQKEYHALLITRSTD